MIAPGAGLTSPHMHIPPGVSQDRADAVRAMPQWERALGIFCLLMFSEAFWGPFFAPVQSIDAETPLVRLIWVAPYVITLALSVWHWRCFARIGPAASLIGGLVILCFASQVWSIDPGATLRRAIALAFTSLFGLYLAARFDGRQMTGLITRAFTFLIIGAYAAALLYPVMGIQHDINAGAWRGLWYEKNQMASVMVLGLIATAASVWLEPQRRWRWGLQAVFIIGLIVLSRSKTSLVAALLCLTALPVLIILKRGGVLSVICLWLSSMVAIIGTGIFLLMPDAVFKALGKDPTLTGRTEIWASLGRLSDKHPWLGYGYKAFWTPTSVPARVVRHEAGWDVPTAHNGWLDLLIQLGWTGVIAFGLILLTGLGAAAIRGARLNDGFFSLIMLGLFSVLILSESFILAQNTLIWPLFCGAFAVATARRSITPSAG
jgi:exopolysaccharide production protein ExoQ